MAAFGGYPSPVARSKIIFEKNNGDPTIIRTSRTTFGRNKNIFGRPTTLPASLSDLNSENIPKSRGGGKGEILGLHLWMGILSLLILRNQFVAPWPMSLFTTLSYPAWLGIHELSGLFFGGGILLTSCIEALVISSRDKPALTSWFSRVPTFQAALVLPGLSGAMISGLALCADRYGGLSLAPMHIKMTLHTLVLFAVWWAATDITTQRRSIEALEKWDPQEEEDDSNTSQFPSIVSGRNLSNLVSCLFVVSLYCFMIIKPGM